MAKALVGSSSGTDRQTLQPRCWKSGGDVHFTSFLSKHRRIRLSCRYTLRSDDTEVD